MIQNAPNLRRFILLGLILLTAWLRLWQLPTIPPGLWFDEAYNTMDVAWMLHTGNWQIFLLGNNGRETLYHYLTLLPIAFFGELIYPVRLVSAFLAILTIPLMYRWARRLFHNHAEPSTLQAAPWLALISTAGLVTSFPFLIMNRAIYRANIFPLLLLLCFYFFWRGWQTNRLLAYGVAGVALGVAQYTYLSARLMPLVLVIFLLLETLLHLQQQQWQWSLTPQLQTAWRGLILMAGISMLVSAPLFAFFAQHPEAFLKRTGDVLVDVNETPKGATSFSDHLLAAARVFLDNGDPNWRHHLVGRWGFDWFNALGFWLGLLIAIHGWRRPAHRFLLIMLGVMWLPAPLSAPAFHTLRLSGMLPAYYALVALGLFSAARWLTRMPRWAGPLSLLSLLLISGSISTYDYFYRWAKLPQVYEAYTGHVTEVAEYLVNQPPNSAVILPFYYYTHPTMRYILHRDYKTERVTLPQDIRAQLQQRSFLTALLPQYAADDGQIPAFALLLKDAQGRGTAYTSEVRRDVAFADWPATPQRTVLGQDGQPLAQTYTLPPHEPLSVFASRLPRKAVMFKWVDNLALSHYEFMPSTIMVGQDSNLFLAWQILGYHNLNQKIFLQLLDAQGQPITQQEFDSFSKKIYRWREQNLILQQHPLNLPPHVEPGLYFARLGFFDPESGHRLPVQGAANQPLGDEVLLGPLYISSPTVDPRQPATPLQANFGNRIALLGYTLTPAENQLTVELFWQAQQPLTTDYTAFVQLLDPHDQLIAQQDKQPLAPIYPPSRWQPGEILRERFVLQLPPTTDLTTLKARLVTGLYNLSSGVRLPVTLPPADEPLPHDLLPLHQFKETP